MRANVRLHAELAATIDRAYAAVDQADRPAVRALIEEGGDAEANQRPAMALGEVHRLALDATAALTSVIDIHRYGSGCSECGTTGLCRTLRGICEIFVPDGGTRYPALRLGAASLSGPRTSTR